MIGKKKNEDSSGKNVATNVENLTIIAQGTMVQGALMVEGNLRLDGSIEGDISCKGKVVLGTQGRIKGNVRSAGAVLHGFLEGDIYTNEDLVLKSTCVVKGDIYTSKLEIEAMAKFNGVCNTQESLPNIMEPVFQKEEKNNVKLLKTAT